MDETSIVLLIEFVAKSVDDLVLNVDEVKADVVRVLVVAWAGDGGLIDTKKYFGSIFFN